MIRTENLARNENRIAWLAYRGFTAVFALPIFLSILWVGIVALLGAMHPMAVLIPAGILLLEAGWLGLGVGILALIPGVIYLWASNKFDDPWNLSNSDAEFNWLMGWVIVHIILLILAAKFFLL